MEELIRFNNDVAKSQEMQEEIKAIDNDPSIIVAYANKKGYQFSMEDVQNLMKKNQILSEEQLDNVAGGVTSLFTGLVGVLGLGRCIYY